MGKSVPVQHPAVVLRSQYRNLRSLVAVLLVALAALTTSVVILAIDGDGISATSTFVGKAPHLSDPFAARTQQSNPQGGVDESSVASAISQSGSRSYPTLADSFQGQAEQPKPQGGGARARSPRPSRKERRTRERSRREQDRGDAGHARPRPARRPGRRRGRRSCSR